jgi:hypothetical protein
LFSKTHQHSLKRQLSLVAFAFPKTWGLPEASCTFHASAPCFHAETLVFCFVSLNPKPRTPNLVFLLRLPKTPNPKPQTLFFCFVSLNLKPQTKPPNLGFLPCFAYRTFPPVAFRYDCVFLSDVPAFTLASHNEARRFMNFVDILYDSVKLPIPKLPGSRPKPLILKHTSRDAGWWSVQLVLPIRPRHKP